MPFIPARNTAFAKASGFHAFALCQGTDPLRISHPEELPQHLSDKTARALIVYNDPVVHIAQQIQEGTDPKSTVVEWQKAANSCLEAARRFRKRVIMCQSPQDYESAISMAKYIDVAEADQVFAENHYHSGVPDIFFKGIAALELCQDATAMDVLYELHARSTGPYQDFPAQSEIKSLLYKGRAELEENRLKLNFDLEKSLISSQKDGKLITLLNNQIEQLSQSLTEVQASLLNAQKANDIAEKSRATREHESALQIQELHAEIDALRNSTSWRITRPMRFVKRIFSQ